jgi:hypothetical protein
MPLRYGFRIASFAGKSWSVTAGDVNAAGEGRIFESITFGGEPVGTNSKVAQLMAQAAH